MSYDTQGAGATRQYVWCTASMPVHVRSSLDEEIPMFQLRTAAVRRVATTALSTAAIALAIMVTGAPAHATSANSTGGHSAAGAASTAICPSGYRSLNGHACP
ncbi:MAG TPA: hypothetical protein VFR11_12290 [Micromonosporaceae bacterium]|nr:hypothetical protein [Micromonosporaceae bacterium]